MGNPLRIKTTGGGTFLGLQEMQTTEMDYAVHQILTEFSTSTAGSGTININGVGTDMGTFTDTIRTESIGAHPTTNAITSSNYTLKQNLSSVAETSIVYPLFLNDSGYAAEHSNNLNTVLISRALANLTSNGIGSYVLAEANPNSSHYTSTGSTVVDSSLTANTTYTLWRKTTGVSAPSTIRTAKLDSGAIKEMSDLEIKALAARLRNQISSTGIGQYKLSATNPAASGETWVQVGGTILDKRNTLADIGYNANYVGDYAASWDKTWTGIYTKQYEAIYEGVFTKQFEKAYIGQYEKHYNKQFCPFSVEAAHKCFVCQPRDTDSGAYASEIAELRRHFK